MERIVWPLPPTAQKQDNVFSALKFREKCKFFKLKKKTINITVLFVNK